MSKAHVLRKHPTAESVKSDDGWSIRAGDTLLGQGKTAGEAWWDATLFCYPEWGKSPEQRAAQASPVANWPFPVSAHKES